jgi:hypothetical protein
MNWWDIKLADDSPEWREYQETARRNSEELRPVVGKLIMGGPPKKRVLPLRAPTVEEVKRLRDNWLARAKQPKPSLAKVLKQFEASQRLRRGATLLFASGWLGLP